MSATPPATLEGWYALHQIFRTDRAGVRALHLADRPGVAGEIDRVAYRITAPGEGWSVLSRLVGGGASWMLVHLRPTLEELAEVEDHISRSPLGSLLELRYDYLSVAEAGMYRATAEVAATEEPGSDAYREALEARLAEDRDNPYVQSRLYPDAPDELRYVSFYPMSKRRADPDNWYTLPIAERNRLMLAHGSTGRRYAGRVRQMITGSIGLDDWEWGVTLFARDPLDLKRIITEMRFDEASARYAEFGRFYTGIRFEPAEWAGRIGLRVEQS